MPTRARHQHAHPAHPHLMLQCTVFYTAPTAIRALMAHGDDWVTKYK